MKAVLAAACVLVGCASAEDHRITQASYAQQYRACQADRRAECVYVGAWLTREFRYDEAREVYRRACTRGEALACVHASERFGERALLLRACKLAVEPCVDAALLPEISAVDREHAVAQVCTKLPARCTELVERLIRKGVDVSAQATQLCTPPGARDRACGELGLLSWPDPAIGHGLLSAACSNGHARACWQLSRRTQDLALARRACELGHKDACDPEAADRMLEKWRIQCARRDNAAEDDSEVSCERLGILLSIP